MAISNAPPELQQNVYKLRPGYTGGVNLDFIRIRLHLGVIVMRVKVELLTTDTGATIGSLRSIYTRQVHEGDQCLP